MEMLKKVDSILFDVDGVLIDTRESYDTAIVKTITILFQKILNIELLASSTYKTNIYLLRSTGGFNNDTDTAYVLSLWLFSGLPKSKQEVVRGLDAIADDVENPKEFLDIISQKVISRTGYLRQEFSPTPPPMEQVVSETIRRTGRQVLSVQDLEQTIKDFVEKNGELRLIETFSRILGQPGRYGESLLETVFCDLYYGPKNVLAIYGRGNYFDFGPGLYLNERINVQESTLNWLTGRLGSDRIGIVSGRDRLSTEIVLGSLMKYFNPNACVFLADEHRLIGEVVKKPSPYGILKAVTRISGATSPMYLGNSAEDFFMAQSVDKYGYKTLFGAVVGLAPNPIGSTEFFASLGADAILEAPDDLVKLWGVV